MGKIFSFIIAVAITVGAGVGGFYFGAKEAKKDVAQISDLGQIVDIDGVVKMYYTSGTLQFKPNTMYAVQCLDSSLNLADFSIIGGSKDGKTGRFALVFVGDKVSESLVLYQTGSVVLSNLAATSGGSTGIKPAASSSQLRYFVLGGKVKG